VGILHRTIFGELARVFVLSLTGITGIIVMAAVVAEASQRGLGPAQILAAIPLIVPSMLPFIIPPTTLFASCVVYGRLAHDNELTAIKSAGVSVLLVVWPGVFLGILMSLVTLSLYYHLIPRTHRMLRTTVVKDAEEYLYAMLKKDHEIKGQDRKQSGEAYEVYAAQVQGRQLKTAIFMKRNAKQEYILVALSADAELHVDLSQHDLLVHMRNAEILQGNGKGTGNFVNFAEYTWTVPLPDMEQAQKPSPRDLTWQELLVARRDALANMVFIKAQVASVVAQQGLLQAPTDLAKHRQNLENILREKRMNLNCINTELQMRPALSAGCLFFVLIGCPVGIWFGRSDYLSAFITCFLPIVFVYYPLQLCSTNLSKDGKLDPLIALWIANAAVGLGAILLFRKLLKN
jgi:lipopolysaccharide export system permease protein